MTDENAKGSRRRSIFVTIINSHRKTATPKPPAKLSNEHRNFLAQIFITFRSVRTSTLNCVRMHSPFILVCWICCLFLARQMFVWASPKTSHVLSSAAHDMHFAQQCPPPLTGGHSANVEVRGRGDAKLTRQSHIRQANVFLGFDKKKTKFRL